MSPGFCSCSSRAEPWRLILWLDQKQNIRYAIIWELRRCLGIHTMHVSLRLEYGFSRGLENSSLLIQPNIRNSVLRNSNAVLVHVSLGHQSGLDFRKVLTAICFEPSRRTSHWSFVHVLEKLHSWHKPDSSKLDEWDEPIKERHKSLDKSSRRGWIYRGLVYLSYGSSHLSN